jgi:AcrR family transcriptional regulator
LLKYTACEVLARLNFTCRAHQFQPEAFVRCIEEPQNARSRRTNAALLRAARELVEQEGFPALTMTAVAERAGVSRRAVYLHCPSRSDLLAALYRDLGQTEELAASLQAVWDSPDAVSALDEWAAHIARSHPRILGILRAMERDSYHDPDAATLWKTAQDSWLKGSRRLMTWLAGEGRLAPRWDVDTAADMMWALMSIDVLDRLCHGRGWSREQIADQLAALYRAVFVS